MSLDACFDREIRILDGQLDNGEISQNDYNIAVRELELEAGDYEQQQMDPFNF
jgi:hypothetical protein